MRQAQKLELHQISVDAARAVLHEKNLGQIVEHATRRLVGERFGDPVVAAAALEPLLPEVREVAETTARHTANATTGAMVDAVREDIETARAAVAGLARDATGRADTALARARGEVESLARNATANANAALRQAHDQVTALAAEADKRAAAALDAARREVADLATTATATAQHAVEEARQEVRTLAEQATAKADAAVKNARDEVNALATETAAKSDAAATELRTVAEKATAQADAAVTELRTHTENAATELRALAEDATAQANAAVKIARDEVSALAAQASAKAEAAIKSARDEVRALAKETTKKAENALKSARSEVIQLAQEAAEKAAAEYVPRPVEVHLADGTTNQVTGHTHQALPDLLLALSARCHVLLVGPAGTGKSMLATHAAQALGLQLQGISLGPTTPMSKVFGYYDAHGKYHDTPFRRAFEHGGVMLLDELDNGHPGLLAELNQALALGMCAFADGMVAAHPDFRLVATANTYGTGGDRQYVGRQALDAATLDRFVMIDVPVDETLEERVAMGLAPGRKKLVRELLTEVRRLRKVAADKQLPVMFSPRVSYDGARLLDAEATLDQVLAWRVVRGLSSSHRSALGLS